MYFRKNNIYLRNQSSCRRIKWYNCGMAKKSIKRIAVLIPSNSPASWQKLEGVMSFAQEHPGWEVSHVSCEHMGSFKRRIRSLRPDGFICVRLDKHVITFLDSLAIPMAIAFHPDETRLKPDKAVYVMSDCKQMGRLAARHAYSRGYRSFLSVGRYGAQWERERMTAFEKEVAKFGCASKRLEAPFRPDELVAELSSLPTRSAVFAVDDLIAIDILNLAHRNGLSVPRSFGVISIANYTMICEHSNPPLTSIDQNFVHAGYLSAKRLDALMSGGIVPKVTIYPPGEIHERESLPQITDRHSLATDLALAFIARNTMRPIEVPDVVVAAGVSRRSLECLFRRELSTSVAQAIRNARLDRLAKEVKSSNMPLSAVCLECGWPYAPHAMNLFKKHFGMTMAQWRA